MKVVKIMADLARHISALSPEKRELLLKKMQEKMIAQQVQQKSVGTTKKQILSQKRETNTFVLSFAQERLWFLHQLDPESVAYNVPNALHFQGTLSLAALEHSVTAVIERHEALRTVFHERNGEPVQVIEAAQPVRLPTVDLSVIERSERDGLVQRIIMQEAQRPFDLATGPLLRATVLRLNEQEHVLLCTLHHIVFDGWSANVFIQELSHLYQAQVKGEESSLPNLPIQYADYAHWQREWLQGDVLQKQLTYWQQQLAGAPTILNLPTDRPRPATQTYEGAAEKTVLPLALLQDLKQLSQREGATLFMTLLASFQVLLMRYSGQQDIVVGSPIANRGQQELNSLIGFFVNTLVLRSDLSGNPGFAQFLAHVRTMTLQAYEHQDLPFEQLIDALHIERSLSHAPLFQVLFVLQNMPQSEINLDALILQPIEIPQTTARLDLAVVAHESEQGLSIAVEYNTALFDAATIQHLLAHWQVLLQGITQHPQLTLADLPLLTAEEQRTLLTIWNTGEQERSAPWGLHQLFEVQVAANPEAVAIVYEQQQLTYEELNRQANRLAHVLHKRGVGVDGVVGVCMERSLEMVIALLAVLKAGGAYVPLDPTAPLERLQWMIEDIQPVILLCQERTRVALPVSVHELVINLDEEGDELFTSEFTGNLDLSIVPEQLAYVIYTSGSSGRPKGVMMSHRGIHNSLLWVQEAYPLTSQDSVLQKAAFTFDPSVQEIFWPLISGARIVLARPDGYRDSPYILALTAQQYVSAQLYAASVLQAALEEDGWEACRSLRYVICGGETLSTELQGLFTTRHQAALINHYGPTEVAIHASAWVCDRDQHAGVVPIGTPISNTQIYLLDDWGKLVPIGVPGEIYIGGSNLARGYLHRPDLSAERFVPHPFSTQPGERIYRTGDLARYRQDGVLEYLGRVDQQIKLRGIRIELGEIEAVLRIHPLVQEAVVMLHEEQPVSSHKYLVGYATAIPDQQLEPALLKSYLRDRLPEVMIPTFMVIMPDFPLTVSNKIDRRALPVPTHSMLSEDQTFVAPQTPVQELLASIWTELLHLPRVSIDISFFELGGHSLLATQVMSRIRQRIPVELPLRALFEAPTIAALARRIELSLQGNEQTTLSPIQARPEERIDLPLSFAQERLWFVYRLEPESTAYHIPSLLRLTGPLNILDLERSLNALVERHEALRTTFHEKGASSIQVIAPDLRINLPIIDLQQLDKAEQDEQVRRIGKQGVECPFELERGPLLRVYLLRLAPQEHVAFFTMHHIISDGWSMSVLIREISELYQTFIEGKTPRLPALPLQYADYALWQRETLQGDFLEQQLAYWQKQLAGAPALLELPTDHPRAQVQSSRGDMQAVIIAPQLSQALRRVSQREGVTLYMLLFSAFLVLLTRYSGQEDIVVGSSIANRTRSELEGLIGFFLNILVLRTDLSGDPSFRTLLARVRETALQAYAHQDVPFEKLVEALKVERIRNVSPLFQVLFVLQNTPQEKLTLGESVWQALKLEQNLVKYDLTLEVEESEQGLYSIVRYKTDLFEAATMRRMLEHWQVLLASIVQNIEQPIATIPLLATSELDQLINRWSGLQQSHVQHCVQSLFEQQVEQAPDAVALGCGDEQFTYADVNQRANRLAHYLLRQGVRPEARVGLCLEKGPMALLGLLAVLKAGGAYIFLDPSLPQARLAYMVQDAQLYLILTQQTLLPYLQDYPGLSLCYDQLQDQLQSEEDVNPSVWLAADSLVSITYTSGSTGRPKGVLNTHEGVINYLHYLRQSYPLNSQMTVLQVPSLAFDAALRDIFGTLVVGGRLVVTQQQETKDLSGILTLLQQHAVTHLLSVVPSFLHTLLDMANAQQVTVRTVQWLLLSGESLPLSTVIRARDIFAEDVTLVNQYGPTEATMTSTYEPVLSHVQPRYDGEMVAIGRPIPNRFVYLLDQQLQPVPTGVRGEVYLGGVGLARGYSQRADETAEKFLPHPFSGIPGQRLYRTGDLARYLADGRLEYLGRIDQQVKIRGNRVEMGEVEQQLELYPGVKRCIALMHAEHLGEAQLVAYLLLEEEQVLASPAQLRTFLQASLPDYMLPVHFIQLEVIPLTLNGKVDLRALPAPGSGTAKENTQSAEPQTRLQKRLTEIWAELLHRPQIGIHENFFQIGGHSLLATLLMMNIHTTFEVSMPLRRLFDFPTIAEMAQFIEQAQIAQMQATISEQENDAEMDRLLRELEELPDDEI